jgi:hypothetical protein
MKISEIKSDEVRNEAVRLAQLEEFWGECRNNEQSLQTKLSDAFEWDLTEQGFDFWFDLEDGTTPNTPDLKLPNL